LPVIYLVETGAQIGPALAPDVTVAGVARLAGEYRVSHRDATDATAHTAETLDQAL
jgi:hypothetical protein